MASCLRVRLRRPHRGPWPSSPGLGRAAGHAWLVGPFLYASCQACAGILEDACYQGDSFGRGQEGTVLGVRAEVTHEGIKARVGQPEMVRGDRPTSLMGEITGKQNVHVVYRADGEMVLPVDPHLRVPLVFLSRQEGWIVKVNPLFSQSRRLPVTEGYPQIRERRGVGF